jgi:hypothetical protein
VDLERAAAPIRAAEPTEHVRVCGGVGDGIKWELPLDRVVQQFMEQQPEEWTRAHLACRYDRQHGYVVGFTAPALDTLVRYVATSAIFGNIAERDHYTASLQWRMTQGVS